LLHGPLSRGGGAAGSEKESTRIRRLEIKERARSIEMEKMAKSSSLDSTRRHRERNIDGTLEERGKGMAMLLQGIE